MRVTKLHWFIFNFKCDLNDISIERAIQFASKTIVISIFKRKGMTESVRVVFEYQCQRCGFSWCSTMFLRSVGETVFIVCRTCRSWVRPLNRVNFHEKSYSKIFFCYFFSLKINASVLFIHRFRSPTNPNADIFY